MPTQNVSLGGALARRQRGVALAILVWFLAAMSLLVAGIVMQARVDVKLAQLHGTRARVEAAADGGIQLALADLVVTEQDGEFDANRVHYGHHTLGSLQVAVSFTPLAGLIDLNMATEELLFLLFSAIEDLDENVAQELAVTVVEWRSPAPGLEYNDAYFPEEATDSQPVASALGHGRFQAIEDLLLIPGIDRQIYEAVRDSVYVNQTGQSGVDWRSAPVSVLRALGMSEEGALELSLAATAEDSADRIAPSDLDLSFQGVAQMPSYRVDALVKADDIVYRRRRWVSRGATGADGLPWSFFRTEAITVASQIETNTITQLENLDAGS